MQTNKKKRKHTENDKDKYRYINTCKEKNTQRKGNSFTNTYKCTQTKQTHTYTYRKTSTNMKND